MDVFTMPVAGLSSDEAINGSYGPAVMPAVTQVSDGAGGRGPVAQTTFPQWSAVLVWWLILAGVAVLAHVLTLRIND